VPAAVADRARQEVEEGIRLAQRGALYSARARFVMALRRITQSLDAQTGGNEHSQALANGFLALEEAGDFQPTGTRLEAQLNLPQIVSTHRTPALKQEDLTNWTAMGALQRYHAYAEQQLTRAGGREMSAADALYGLARIQPHLASPASDQAARSGPVAMSLYQAALTVEPQHYLAANELGALFARYGQWPEAREALRHAVAVRPDCPVLWENLARVHEQLGERDLAELALHEWQVAVRYSSQPQTPAPQVQWVDAGTFAALSRDRQDAPNAAPLAATEPDAAVRSTGPQSLLLPSNQDKPLSVGQRQDCRRIRGR
jgi:tetratricopeptide (TPR) repeat protein